MIRTPKTSLGCLLLFALPFCAVGLFTAGFAVVRAAAGDWREAGFLAVFGLVFGGAGFGILALGFYGQRRQVERERLRRQHPDEPWLWRREWAGGRIEDGSRRKMIFVWVFAAFWNLVSLPGVFAALEQGVFEEGNVAWLVLLFPLVGLGLLVWAVRITWRRRKFGVSVFRMASVPGVVGRALHGVVITATPVRADEGFHVTLSCVNRITTGSGKNRSTREKVLWQDERRVTRTPVVADGATAVPVAFRLPGDARESDDSDPDNEILWRLEAEAEVPGIDYHAAFQVPVFRTPESDKPLTPEEEAPFQLPDEEAYRQAPDSRIYVTTSLTRTEIYFAPARNIGAALGLTTFLAVWVGAIVLMTQLGAPLLFPIVFSLFGLLLLAAALSLWLGTTRVVASPEGLEVRNGILGLGRRRWIPAEDVEDIDLKVGMQAGKKAYHDIKIVTSAGKKITAGSAIPDRREAEWLVERMWQALDGR